MDYYNIPATIQENASIDNVLHSTKRHNISSANEPKDLASAWGRDENECRWVQKHKSRALYTIDAFILAYMFWGTIVKQNNEFVCIPIKFVKNDSANDEA